MKFFRKLLTFILIVLLAFGVYFAANWVITGDAPMLFSTIDKKAVLVMGMDESGLRSDVMMLAIVDGRSGNVDVISIPRDTRVKVEGSRMKINAAHAIGKEELAMKTVENLLDVEVDHYVKFSFETFRRVIDALGGVDYNVPQDMKYYDPYQELEIDLEEGYQHLDGDEAEQLVRFRQYPMGDEDRIKVQQDFLKELVKQKLNAGIILRLPMLAKEIGECIETDIPADKWISYANVVRKMDENSVQTYQLPGGAQNINGVSYYICDENETEDVMKEITARHSGKKTDE